MEVAIKGTPKEIADLALALQNQPEEKFIPSHAPIMVSESIEKPHYQPEEKRKDKYRIPDGTSSGRSLDDCQQKALKENFSCTPDDVRLKD